METKLKITYEYKSSKTGGKYIQKELITTNTCKDFRDNQQRLMNKDKSYSYRLISVKALRK